MYWEFWMGGLALACVAVAHWLIVGRMMAVSGRFTVMVNRLRFGAQQKVEASDEDLIAAMQAATLAEFGDDAAASEPAAAPAVEATSAPVAEARPPQTLAAHTVFLVSLVFGGMLASMTSSNWSASTALRGDLFSQYFGRDPIVTAAVLVTGGLLIGFGTRMAAGCTSGHGLCGVSRFQVGSLAATASFFGAAIAVSVALRVVA